MKNPFKVGDRVRVYGNSQVGITPSGTVGEIITVFRGSCWINIAINKELLTFHEKQLRRMVKKKRREFWITIVPGWQERAWPTKELAIDYMKHSPNPYEVVLFREVKEK